MTNPTTCVMESVNACLMIYVFGNVSNGAQSQLPSPVIVSESETASFRWQLPAVSGGLTVLYVISPSRVAVLLANILNNHQAVGNYTVRVTYTGNLTADPKVMAFDLFGVVRSDAGIYTCGRTGVSDIIPGCGQKLVVLDQPPRPTLNGSPAPVFGRQVSLTCSSTSTTVPADHGLTLTYTWQRDNTDITVTSPGSPYTFTVSSQDSHSYRCRARESQGLESEWSKVYNMEPQYGPYAVALQPSTLSYTRREGQESVPSILCSATCKPVCTNKWLKSGTFHSDGATLTLLVSDRSKTGSYKCQTSNTHGTVDSSSVLIDVTYQASINMLIGNSLSGSVTVSESDPVTFRSELDNAGKPRSAIRLLNGSEELTRTDNSLTATYRLEAADCRQRGNYFCTATNNIGEPVSQRVELLVKWPPQTPAQFRDLDNATMSFVWLSWLRGFNGGHPQTFLIEYRQFPTGTWVVYNSYDDIGETMVVEVTGLISGEIYTFRLRARNDFGDSNRYVFVETTTAGDAPVQQKRDAPCTYTGVVAGATVGGVLLALLIGGIVLTVLYRKGYRVGNISKDARKSRHPEPVEMDNRGYSSLDQINASAQYSNLEDASEKQQYTQLKIYENTKVDTAADTSTYEGVTEAPPVTYESIRASPYQNTEGQSKGPDHRNN